MTNKEKERAIYYGSRKADKLIRCYWKEKINAFRVEEELHGSLLRRNDISTLDDFVYLPQLIYPKHLQFVALDRKRLERYLVRNFGGEGHQILEGTIRRASSLRRLRQYLSRKRIFNVHRFLVPLPLNEEVRRALEKWARHFKKESRWANTK